MVTFTTLKAAEKDLFTLSGDELQYRRLPTHTTACHSTFHSLPAAWEALQALPTAEFVTDLGKTIQKSFQYYGILSMNNISSSSVSEVIYKLMKIEKKREISY